MSIESKAKAGGRLSRRNGAVDLDQTDSAILRVLADDGRVSRADLARRVNLSAPATGERVRRLEESGVITGYRAEFDYRKLGCTLTILIRARPLPGRMDEMARAMRETPQIEVCERVSGEDCYIARAYVRDVEEMEAVIDRLMPFGATSTAIVQSAPVPVRLVEVNG